MEAFGNHILKTNKSCKKNHQKMGKIFKKNGDENNKNKDNDKLQNWKENMFFADKIGKKWPFLPS